MSKKWITPPGTGAAEAAASAASQATKNADQINTAMFNARQPYMAQYAQMMQGLDPYRSMFNNYLMGAPSQGYGSGKAATPNYLATPSWESVGAKVKSAYDTYGQMNLEDLLNQGQASIEQDLLRRGMTGPSSYGASQQGDLITAYYRQKAADQVNGLMAQLSAEGNARAEEQNNYWNVMKWLMGDIGNVGSAADLTPIAANALNIANSYGNQANSAYQVAGANGAGIENTMSSVGQLAAMLGWI